MVALDALRGLGVNVQDHSICGDLLLATSGQTNALGRFIIRNDRVCLYALSYLDGIAAVAVLLIGDDGTLLDTTHDAVS